MGIAFHQMNGLGNDFVIIDARAQAVAFRRHGQLRGLWKAPAPVPTPLPAPAHTPLNYASYQAAQVHAP